MFRVGKDRSKPRRYYNSPAGRKRYLDNLGEKDYPGGKFCEGGSHGTGVAFLLDSQSADSTSLRDVPVHGGFFCCGASTLAAEESRRGPASVAKEEVRMGRYLGTILGFLAGLLPSVAWAEGATGYSRGNAMLYYSLIAFVLIYGLHDTFHEKWLTWAGAIIIPILFYLNLPAQ